MVLCEQLNLEQHIMAFVFRQGDLPKLDLQRSIMKQILRPGRHNGMPTTLSQVYVTNTCFSRRTSINVDNLGLSREQRNNDVAAIHRYVFESVEC